MRLVNKIVGLDLGSFQRKGWQPLVYSLQWHPTFQAATHFAIQFNRTTPFRKFPVKTICKHRTSLRHEVSCVGKRNRNMGKWS